MEVEGPDRDWKEEDYYGYTDEDRMELIIDNWPVKDPNHNKTLVNHLHDIFVNLKFQFFHSITSI